ncbi:hypothetical protein Cni_G29017 [Canna indica]|uniref:MTD1 n=1 Tax=Canna indica TaxID=4628 RepID=A0AAQ3L7J7_9LILI|nr:hypothetical protein Cni_G29017 [Canna indica]
MSIALEKGSGIGRSGFVRGIAAKCCPIYEVAAAAAEGMGGEEDSSNSSSSIGRNSSAGGSGDGTGSGGEGGTGEEEAEVQSRLKAPLETLDSLEDSLPLRRGISNFYCGKSKSFSSLSDAFALSSKDLAKQENAYTRKRKNLLAFSIMSSKFGNKDQTSMEGGISKKPANSGRSICTPSVISGISGSRMGSENHQGQACLPPRHPQGKSAVGTPAGSPLSSSPHEIFSVPMRSFSLTDLQCVVSASSVSQLR